MTNISTGFQITLKKEKQQKYNIFDQDQSGVEPQESNEEIYQRLS